MRLLHVTHQYRPAIGGAERYMTDLSEELARRGHQVDVFTSRSQDFHTWQNELPAFERLDGVNVFRFSSLPRRGLAWRALDYGFRNYWRTGARYYEPFIVYGNGPISPGLFAAILHRGRRYDLVHINHLHYAHAVTAAWAANLRFVPFVVTPHLHMEQRATYDVSYLQSVLRRSRTILADTQAEKEFILDRGWHSQVVVAGHGLHLERFPPLCQAESRASLGLPETGFLVLFLARKAEYKGLKLCLDAFARLRARRHDVFFAVFGPETDYSQALWSRYRELDGLIVRGHVSDQERLAALAACDVLAMPSTGEAFGIVYLEAWAYRKPVIGARILSVASLIEDGQDGFLIEPGDLKALVRRLNCLADHPELAREMGNRGRRKLERRYTTERIGDIVEATCARVLRRHRTNSHR